MDTQISTLKTPSAVARTPSSAIIPTMTTLTKTLTIACLCAQWCDTCKDYAPMFAQLQQDFSHAHLVWVDIEDQADLVDPIEVENFPTILIATDGQARFFGTVTPHLDTLRRLIQAQLDASNAAPCSAEVQAFTERLLRHAGA